MPKQLHWK